MRLIGIDDDLPDGRPLLLHRREPPHLPRPVPRRRPASTSTLICCATTRSGSTSSRRCVRREDDESETLIGDGRAPAAPRRHRRQPRRARRRRGARPPGRGRGSPRRDRPSGCRRAPRRPGPLTQPGQAHRSRRGAPSDREARGLPIPHARGDPPRPEHGLLDLLRRRAGQLGHEVDVAGQHVAGHALGAEARRGRPVSRTSPGRTTTATMTSSSLSSLGTP